MKQGSVQIKNILFALLITAGISIAEIAQTADTVQSKLPLTPSTSEQIPSKQKIASMIASRYGLLIGAAFSLLIAGTVLLYRFKSEQQPVVIETIPHAKTQEETQEHIKNEIYRILMQLEKNNPGELKNMTDAINASPYGKKNQQIQTSHDLINFYSNQDQNHRHSVCTSLIVEIQSFQQAKPTLTPKNRHIIDTRIQLLQQLLKILKCRIVE